MRLPAIVLATAVMAWGLVCGAAALAAPAATPSRPELAELLALVNRHRVALGKRPLRWDARLAAVAQRHSEDMARRGFFDHVNPDGADPFDRMRAAGIEFQAAAENLAEGQRTPAEVFAGWMASRGHRRNLEDGDYTRCGLGLFRHRWTCTLARTWSDLGEPPPAGPRHRSRRSPRARRTRRVRAPGGSVASVRTARRR